MIEIATKKDLMEMWVKLEEVRDRTKRHTIQIKELQKEERQK